MVFDNDPMLTTAVHSGCLILQAVDFVIFDWLQKTNFKCLE